MQRMNRITPAMPASGYQTYRIWRPDRGTFWRPATCAQVDCAPYLRGWTTTVDESSELGQRQAWYIRSASARRFSEYRDDAGLTVFTFEAGQSCFRSDTHQVATEREPLYLVKPGDWRGGAQGRSSRVHARAEDWVEDFGEHQDKIKSARERG